MKKKHNTMQKQGFISIATMILMIMSLGVVTAMLYRAVQGNLIASRLEQSNQAYQDGDTASERVLMDFRKIDTSGQYKKNGIDSTYKIPQNIPALKFCVIPVVCYNASGVKITIFTNPPAMLSDVTRIGTQGTEVSATRALQVSVPQRVFIPKTVVTANVIPLTTNVRVAWSAISDPSSQYNTIEVRRAELTQAQFDEPNPADLLSDTSLDWIIVGVRLAKNAVTIDDTTTVTKKYYAYTLKMTNKQSLNLDSLYVLPRTIQVSP